MWEAVRKDASEDVDYVLDWMAKGFRIAKIEDERQK